MENIKVSVIMPVYNSGNYLAPAIDSILIQSLKDFELILVDDGSTDGSSQLCDEYALKDNRVVVVHQSNQGLCSARNYALSISRGEYIAFSDHDDLYLQGLLEDNYNIAKKNDLDFIKFCKCWDIIKDGKTISHQENHIQNQVITRKELPNIIYLLNRKDFFACVWDGLYKKDFLTQNNIIFDTYYKYGGEDYDFINKCLVHTQRFGTNEKCYYYHYIRWSFSTSTKFNPKKIEVQRKRFENFCNLLDSLGLSTDNVNIEYTWFYIYWYLLLNIRQLNRMDISDDKRCQILSSFKTESIYKPCLKNTRLSLMKYKHYPIVLWLFNHGFYKFLLKVYRLIG